MNAPDDRPELRTIANPRARSRHADAWPMAKWKARKRRRGYGRTANARSDAGLR